MNFPPSLQMDLHKTRDRPEKITANAREAENRSFLPNHIQLVSAAGALVTAGRKGFIVLRGQHRRSSTLL